MAQSKQNTFKQEKLKIYYSDLNLKETIKHLNVRISGQYISQQHKTNTCVSLWISTSIGIYILVN